MPHEVLTLQFGEFANYVGAHYWNIQVSNPYQKSRNRAEDHAINLIKIILKFWIPLQDEIFGLQGGPGKEHGAESQIASEVLYQERITPQSSFVPRLVIFNAKGSLGPVRAQAPPNIESALHPPNAAHTWSGHTEVHISPGVRKNKFQEELETESESNAPVIVADRDEEEEAATALELAAQALDAPGAVRYFTDFLKVPINARNLHLVEGLWHHGPGLQGWGQAGGLAHQAEERDAAAEKIRVLAEEADALSGFQCFIEDLSAWGSVSGQVLQDVRDDYGSGKAVLLFCTRRSTGGEAPQPSDLRRRRMCEALSTSLLSQHCDLYVPVQAPTRYSAFPALRWRQGDLFHESALCGVAVHGATLPYRLATGVADPALGKNSRRKSSDVPNTEFGVSALKFPSVASVQVELICGRWHVC